MASRAPPSAFPPSRRPYASPPSSPPAPRHPRCGGRYVLPAAADPEYRCSAGESAGESADAVDLKQLLARQHQHIRALPVARGTALAWSHRLIHWGAAHGGGAGGARKTLAFALASPSFEPPLLRVPSRTPPLGARLAIIAHLLIRYHHEASHPAPLWPATLLQALQLLRDNLDHLSDAALEWYSVRTDRGSPVAQGSILQCNLVTLHAEQRRVADNATATAASRQMACDSLVAVGAIVDAIVRVRGLSVSDELGAIGRVLATPPPPSRGEANMPTPVAQPTRGETPRVAPGASTVAMDVVVVPSPPPLPAGARDADDEYAGYTYADVD